MLLIVQRDDVITAQVFDNEELLIRSDAGHYAMTETLALPALLPSPGQLASLTDLAVIPGEEVWLASQMSARTRGARQRRVTTWPATNRSNRMRTAGSYCFTLGAAIGAGGSPGCREKSICSSCST
jgi:hypothetical protein